MTSVTANYRRILRKFGAIPGINYRHLVHDMKITKGRKATSFPGLFPFLPLQIQKREKVLGTRLDARHNWKLCTIRNRSSADCSSYHTVCRTASLVLDSHGKVVSTSVLVHLTAAVECVVIVTANRFRHSRWTTGWTFTSSVPLAIIAVRVRDTQAAPRTDYTFTYVILAFYHLERKM